MMKTNDPNSLLAALGVSFRKEMDITLSPEEIIISLICDHQVIYKRRLLSLLILAFQNFQDYFRPDIFFHLLPNMDGISRRVLGGIIFRPGLKNPSRWKRLKNFIEKEDKTEVYISSHRMLELRAGDEGFSQFRILITRVAGSHEKKLMRENWILKYNPWFKNRLLFGPSSRADVYTMKTNFLEANPNRIARRFNLSYPSIHGIWNDIILAQEIGHEVLR